MKTNNFALALLALLCLPYCSKEEKLMSIQNGEFDEEVRRQKRRDLLCLTISSTLAKFRTTKLKNECIKLAIYLILILYSIAPCFAQTKYALEKVKKICDEGGVLNYIVGDNDGGYFIGFNNGRSYAYRSSSGAKKYIEKIFNEGDSIKSIAFTPKGDGWVIIYNKNAAWWNNIPYELENKIKELNKKGSEINFVQFANNGGWILIYDSGYSYSFKNFPSDAGNAVSSKHNQGHRIKSISFTPSGGWLLIYGTNGYVSSDIYKLCLDVVKSLNNEKTEIYSAVFTEFNECAILYDGGVYSNFTKNDQIDDYENSLNEYAPWTKLDVNNIVLNDGSSVSPCIHITGDNILTIESVHIRNNGEYDGDPVFGRGAAALGIEIMFSNDAQNWYSCYGMPLIGRHYEGSEDKGECRGYAKLEWGSNEAIKYKNYGLLDWDAWAKYKYIRFKITEGDHEHDPKFSVLKNAIKYSPLRWIPGVRSSFKNDTVFDMYESVDLLRGGKIIKLKGNDCTLWLQTKRNI